MMITLPQPVFLFFPSVGPLEIGVVFAVILILFGPGKLPEVFRAMGDGVRQFRDATKSISSDSNSNSGTAKE